MMFSLILSLFLSVSPARDTNLPVPEGMNRAEARAIKEDAKEIAEKIPKELDIIQARIPEAKVIGGDGKEYGLSLDVQSIADVDYNLRSKKNKWLIRKIKQLRKQGYVIKYNILNKDVEANNMAEAIKYVSKLELAMNKKVVVGNINTIDLSDQLLVSTNNHMKETVEAHNKGVMKSVAIQAAALNGLAMGASAYVANVYLNIDISFAAAFTTVVNAAWINFIWTIKSNAYTTWTTTQHRFKKFLPRPSGKEASMVERFGKQWFFQSAYLATIASSALTATGLSGVEYQASEVWSMLKGIPVATAVTLFSRFAIREAVVDLARKRAAADPINASSYGVWRQKTNLWIGTLFAVAERIGQMGFVPVQVGLFAFSGVGIVAYNYIHNMKTKAAFTAVRKMNHWQNPFKTYQTIMMSYGQCKQLF